MAEETGRGITRRDALRRGSLAGLGLIWVTPQMSSFTMTAQFAQATSPVTETTQPGSQTTEATTGPTTEKTEPSTGPTTVETQPPSTESVEPTVRGTTVEPTTPSTAKGPESRSEIEDEVLSGQLPFTGLPLEQLIPLAGGTLATGAAVLRAARERKENPGSVEADQPDDAV